MRPKRYESWHEHARHLINKVHDKFELYYFSKKCIENKTTLRVVLEWLKLWSIWICWQRIEPTNNAEDDDEDDDGDCHEHVNARAKVGDAVSKVNTSYVDRFCNILHITDSVHRLDWLNWQCWHWNLLVVLAAYWYFNILISFNTYDTCYSWKLALPNTNTIISTTHSICSSFSCPPQLICPSQNSSLLISS